MKVLVCYPFDTIHSLIILSKDADAKYYPLGGNSTLETGSL